MSAPDQTPYAAIRFRGRVFSDEYHVDCLKDCIECADWPESHSELADIIDGEKEPIEFGRLSSKGEFVPFDFNDQTCRTEWYIREQAR